LESKTSENLKGKNPPVGLTGPGVLEKMVRHWRGQQAVPKASEGTQPKTRARDYNTKKAVGQLGKKKIGVANWSSTFFGETGKMR